VGFRVYLDWTNASAVLALAQAVSDPANPSYRAYLSPSQFRQQFSPSVTSVSQVVTWLHSQGFTIDYIPANRHYIAAEGTVAQAAAAFRTTFGTYRVDGLTLRSPSSALSVPSRLGVVEAVVGLDDSAQFVHPDAITGQPPTPVTVTGTPCSRYYGEKESNLLFNGHSLPYAPCGYTASQVSHAYGFAPIAQDGSGQTVAVVDAYSSPTVGQDLTQWSTNHGLPQPRAGQLTQVVAPGAFQRAREDQQ